MNVCICSYILDIFVEWWITYHIKCANIRVFHISHWQYHLLHIIHGCIWIFDHKIKSRNYNVSCGYRAFNLVTTLPFIYKLVLAPIINQRFLSVIDRQMIYCPNMKRMIDFPYWSIQWLIDDEPILSFCTNCSSITALLISSSISVKKMLILKQ